MKHSYTSEVRIPAPNRVIIQAAVTHHDHYDLWHWWLTAGPGKGEIVRQALAWFFFGRKEQLDRIENMLIELLAERLGK